MSKEPVYDTYRQDLTTGGALTAEELKNIRFGVTLRGYAMAQVDDLLDRLALEITERAEGATVRQRLQESTASARAAEQSAQPDPIGPADTSGPPEHPPAPREDRQSGQ